MKDACAKLMIFITPNTINRPAETMKRIAAVVMMSRASVIMRANRIAAGGKKGVPSSRRRRSTSRLQVRALRARIDIGKALDDLHRAVGLHLAEIHGQRRVMLLRHIDLAARTFYRDLAKRLQDLGLLGAAGLFRRGLVSIDRFIFRHRKVVRGLQLSPEFLLHGSQKALVGGAVDAGHIGGGEIDACGAVPTP